MYLLATGASAAAAFEVIYEKKEKKVIFLKNDYLLYLVHF